jgi:hypothetical protein
MNKVQYIKLLEVRGVTELMGSSVGKAIKETGGNPTLEELCLVNQRSMDFYIEKYKSELIKNEVLSARNNELIERDEWLTCLEEAGVDNWSGIDLANEIKEESY